MVTVPQLDNARQTPAIELRFLRVDYGDLVAVHDLSLSIPPGEVFGLVGPNGAGKTSAFRVVTTLMEPTYGEVLLHGVDAFEEIETARRILGYMPDLAPVPTDLKAWEFLDFHAAAYGLGRRAERRARVEESLEEVALSGARNQWCRELSRGQTQRLVLAKTLLHRPRVLVLDEPASGLDPLARRDLRQTLQRIAAAGATVFISSHILSELAEMCTSVCVMNRGRLLAAGTVDHVRQQLGNTERVLTATFLAGAQAAAHWLGEYPAVHDVRAAGNQVLFGFRGSDEDQADLVEGLLKQGVRLTSFEERRSSLEEMLLRVAERNRTQ